MIEARPLSIPVILGTTRKGRMSAHAAQFVFGQLQKRAGTRRMNGFGIHPGVVDGMTLGRMYRKAIRGAGLPKYQLRS